MDSLYEPVPEQQNNKENAYSATNTCVKRGQSTRFSMATELDENPVESTGTLQRLWRLAAAKKTGERSVDEPHRALKPPDSPQDSNHSEEGDDTFVSCMKLMKSQEKKICKDNTTKNEETESKVNFISPSLGRSLTSRSSYLEDSSPHSGSEFQLWPFNDWKTSADNPLWPGDVLISQTRKWGSSTCSAHHSVLTSSLIDMDLPHSWRSSSFGNFDRFRSNSVFKPEDANEKSEVEGINENREQEPTKTPNNGGSLGKKMRAISWTMKKKIGKKYIKALSEDRNEEDAEDAGQYRNSDPGLGAYPEKFPLQGSDSMESIYSGQSSSSGITSCSDGTSNRDSFRLDDEVLYTGPFCGRAKVHTDFTPSPYDTDSLKIKKGDIIDIICKTPMGIWTGMLNKKVGNFKFIYVDIILEEEAIPKKIKAHQKSKMAKPQTVQEFLERILLQEYASTLLLNGYETLEDLKDLKESHLIELNIKNPEDRKRLLSAAENLLDDETVEEETEPIALTLNADVPFHKSQLNERPRDSGCFISSENSENSKEDPDSEHLSQAMKKMTITESND
ncbi:SAM domain-containing protein SAMSN-1 isoform X1 [Monodelphis domestica]|uniref:SAM domain-containing protein SAMSN-1 isoform X1 n=1 Tax=Monodelphis domestica TaxID=13616 RepID=UPI00028BEA76|nr:SAM domain-containing protein SAMSN-1 isoform X1 [Monodelphis domestica]